MRNVRAHIYVTGVVQGVWYRATAMEKAREMGDLLGWVKNRPDGSVELMCEGPEEKIKKLVEWLWQGPELAQVSDVQITWQKDMGEFDTFTIRN